MSNYAMMVPIVLNGRYDMYYDSIHDRNRAMTHKTNSLFEAIGINANVTVTYPLIEYMETFDTFRALLTAMFIVLVIGSVFLAGILVFALLRINSEERQFEMAMFRAQGMPKQRLIFVFLCQTLFFTLPGVTFGILFA
uniref:Putative ABC transporter permease yclI n=1 Tax=Lygus hesperus TaxID=30085 RepID=A0A0A9W8V0_LYGHE